MASAEPKTVKDLHRLSIEELKKRLNVNFETGITEAEVETRLAQHGRNELEEEEKETLWDKIKEQFEDKMVRLLLLAALVSFLVSIFGRRA